MACPHLHLSSCRLAERKGSPTAGHLEKDKIKNDCDNKNDPTAYEECPAYIREREKEKEKRERY
jgi:hypothetical protein